MSMEQGYPSEADINDDLDAFAIEWIPEYSVTYTDPLQAVWGLVNAFRFAGALSVYPATATTIQVRGGDYCYQGVIKTFSPGAAIDPTDNDTTYVWLTPAGTVSSTVDGTGWPATEHIKLAEVTVDSDGNITDIVDRRGQAFLNFATTTSAVAAAWVELMPLFWDSPSPADADEMRLPLYANNDADEQTEFGRITLTLSDVSDASEDAALSFSVMVAGALTSQGDLVGTASANATGNSLATVSADGGVPVIFTATLTAGSTVQIHNADAPYKYRVLDAWSIATSADGGTWKLTDGTNDITDAVAVTATDKTVDEAGTIDDAYHEIAASGSLSAVGDGALADVEVYVLAVRVA